MSNAKKILLTTVSIVCLGSSALGTTDLVDKTRSSKPVLGGTLPYNDGSIVDVSKLKYDPVREMYYMDLAEPTSYSDKPVRDTAKKSVAPGKDIMGVRRR